MEKTGCKIICGAPTTLAVKGLMVMMMMSSVSPFILPTPSRVVYCLVLLLDQNARLLLHKTTFFIAVTDVIEVTITLLWNSGYRGWVRGSLVG